MLIPVLIVVGNERLGKECVSGAVIANRVMTQLCNLLVPFRLFLDPSPISVFWLTAVAGRSYEVHTGITHWCCCLNEIAGGWACGW